MLERDLVRADASDDCGHVVHLVLLVGVVAIGRHPLRAVDVEGEFGLIARSARGVLREDVQRELVHRAGLQHILGVGETYVRRVVLSQREGHDAAAVTDDRHRVGRLAVTFNETQLDGVVHGPVQVADEERKLIVVLAAYRSAPHICEGGILDERQADVRHVDLLRQLAEHAANVGRAAVEGDEGPVFHRVGVPLLEGESRRLLDENAVVAGAEPVEVEVVPEGVYRLEGRGIVDVIDRPAVAVGDHIDIGGLIIVEFLTGIHTGAGRVVVVRAVRADDA